MKFIKKRSRGYTYLIAFAGLCLALSPVGTIHAEECKLEPQAALHVTYNGFIPTVHAKINDQDVAMGVDTGAQRTVLSTSVLQRLNIEQDPNIQSQVYGTSGHESVHHAKLDSFWFAGITYKPVNLPIVPMHLPTIGRSIAPDDNMAGLIGADIL